jgi:hypothetical protein
MAVTEKQTNRSSIRRSSNYQGGNVRHAGQHVSGTGGGQGDGRDRPGGARVQAGLDVTHGVARYQSPAVGG